MSRTSMPASTWRDQIVATRTSNGQIFLLLFVEKQTCPICRYGVRFDTTWGAPSGEIHRVSWCKSCFNADCEHAKLTQRQRTSFRKLVEQASRQPVLSCWNSARPAIEDLEQRGLI